MNNTRKLIYSLRYVFIVVFIVLITASYHPTIVSLSRSAGYESGTILSRYITLVFIVLFALCLSMAPLKNRFVKTYVLMLAPIAIVSLWILAFYNNGMMMDTIRDIVLCLFAVFIGWTLNLKKTELEYLLLFFSVMVLFVGFFQVMTNIGGFVIKNQYLVDAKNSLGVLLGSSVISMLVVWRTTNRPAIRFWAFVSGLIGIFIILTIRARAAFLAVLFVGLIVLFKSTRGRTFAIVSLILFIVLFITLPFLPDVIYNYVYDSLFSGTQADDVSSGRLSTYQYALSFLSEGNHIWFGDVNQSDELGHWIHNFPLLQVYRYGLVYSLPLLVFYVYLAFFSFAHAFRFSSHIFEVGYSLVSIIIIISLLEPTFPFSPGTATLLNYIVLGSTLRFSDLKLA